MKRGITVIIAVLVLSLCLFCSCVNNNVEANDENEKSYSFIYKGIEIVPSSEMEPIKNQLGEPTSYYESVSCAFEGMDKIYTYGSIQITTYTEKEVDYVYTIVLLDDSVTTPEGLYIGANVTNVEGTYGEIKAGQNLVTYVRGKSSITIGLRDNIVVSITYTAIN